MFHMGRSGDTAIYNRSSGTVPPLKIPLVIPKWWTGDLPMMETPGKMKRVCLEKGPFFKMPLVDIMKKLDWTQVNNGGFHQWNMVNATKNWDLFRKNENKHAEFRVNSMQQQNGWFDHWTIWSQLAHELNELSEQVQFPQQTSGIEPSKVRRLTYRPRCP